MTTVDEARAALAAEIRAGDFEDRGWMIDALDRALALLEPAPDAEARPEGRVMSHFLAVRHESYDSDAMYGIFDTLQEAVHALEQADDRSAAIELWVGTNIVESREWISDDWMTWEQYRALGSASGA
jgi:hypothetical protein